MWTPFGIYLNRIGPFGYRANGDLPEAVGMTPGQLVKAVALALDVPEETVVQHDRNLVVAGLRTKGGRGRSAAKVTPLDAARLIVAVLGSLRTKDTVATVRAFEKTEFDPPKSQVEIVAILKKAGIAPPGDENTVWDDSKFADPAIEALPKDHNFVQAMASIISDASQQINDMERYLERFVPFMIYCDSKSGGNISKMGNNRPILRSETVGGAYRIDGVKREWSPRPPKTELEKTEPVHKKYSRHVGIHQTRVITGATIMLVGKAFRDDGLQYRTADDALNALYGQKKASAKSKKKAA
jgi:hypothetical protein